MGFIKTVNVGTDKVRLEAATAIEFSPVELHMKEDGSKNGKPSFTWVMVNPHSPVTVYAQFSLDSLIDAFDELGFEIKKKI
jgi:hypothetical protein